MKVTEFYNEVSRRVDTPGTKINVAETKRVLAIAFEVLCEMSAVEAVDTIANALGTASKKKTAPAGKKAKTPSSTTAPAVK